MSGMWMKLIIKGPQPTELLQWRNSNRIYPENLKYNRGGFPRNEVLNAALKEQGFLCAYTLLIINKKTSHVEHLKPQELCQKEDCEREKQGCSKKYEDIDWHNMVACFPQPNSPHPGFGAVHKNQWWDLNNFLSPLTENCESRFSFNLKGEIFPASKNDTAAIKTIKMLKLDCDRLNELRKNAIFEYGFHLRADNPIKSIKAVRKRTEQLRLKQNNRYAAFVTVLIKVADEYILKLERHRQIKKYSNPTNRKNR